MKALDTQSLLYELEAFESYSSRGGRFSFEDWMDTKDFRDRDRVVLRAMWNRAAQRG